MSCFSIDVPLNENARGSDPRTCWPVTCTGRLAGAVRLHRFRSRRSPSPATRRVGRHMCTAYINPDVILRASEQKPNSETDHARTETRKKRRKNVRATTPACTLSTCLCTGVACTVISSHHHVSIGPNHVCILICLF